MIRSSKTKFSKFHLINVLGRGRSFSPGIRRSEYKVLQSLRKPAECRMDIYSAACRSVIAAALLFAAFLATAPAAQCQIAESYEPKNEFGVWAGYSPDSPHLIGVTSERQLGLLAVRYARTLWQNQSLSLQYTIDILPLELVLQPKILAINTNPPRTTFITGSREYVYGGGINPIGFKVNLLRRHRLQPFFASSAGFIATVNPVPIDVSGEPQFNFQFDFQGGLQRYNSSRTRAWTLGYKLLHISNANRADLNPGMDAHVIFLGYSFFR